MGQSLSLIKKYLAESHMIIIKHDSLDMDGLALSSFAHLNIDYF